MVDQAQQDERVESDLPRLIESMILSKRGTPNLVSNSEIETRLKQLRTQAPERGSTWYVQSLYEVMTNHRPATETVQKLIKYADPKNPTQMQAIKEFQRVGLDKH